MILICSSIPTQKEGLARCSDLFFLVVNFCHFGKNILIKNKKFVTYTLFFWKSNRHNMNFLNKKNHPKSQHNNFLL
jgi:hypothetical protein